MSGLREPQADAFFPAGSRERKFFDSVNILDVGRRWVPSQAGSQRGSRKVGYFFQ